MKRFKTLDEDIRGIILGAVGFALMIVGGYMIFVLGYALGCN